MKGFVLGIATTLALLLATVSFARINEASLLQAMLPQMVVHIEQDVPVNAYLALPNPGGDAVTVTLPLTLAVDLRIGLSTPLSVTLDIPEGSAVSVYAEVEPTPTPSPLADLDRTDAAQVATAILNAYRNKDLESLAALSNQGNQRLIRDLLAEGEGSDRYQSIFSGWRWEAVAAWDGIIREVRYRHFVGSNRDTYEAHAHFADFDDPEIATVVLQWENEQWTFEDINSPTLGRFQQGRTEFTLDPAPY